MNHQVVSYPRRKWRLVGTAGLVATAAMAFALGPAGKALRADAATSICQKITPATVSSILKVKALSSTKSVNGSVTVCWYRVGANTHAAFVRVQRNVTLSGFKGDLKLAKTYAEHPVTDGAFAPYPAFSTTIGSATYGYTYSVTVLKRSTELSVGAVGTTLKRVESLTTRVLPLL